MTSKPIDSSYMPPWMKEASATQAEDEKATAATFEEDSFGALSAIHIVMSQRVVDFSEREALEEVMESNDDFKLPSGPIVRRTDPRSLSLSGFRDHVRRLVGCAELCVQISRLRMIFPEDSAGDITTFDLLQDDDRQSAKLCLEQYFKHSTSAGRLKVKVLVGVRLLRDNEKVFEED